MQVSFVKSSKSWFIGYGIAKYPTPVLHYPILFPSLNKSFGWTGFCSFTRDCIYDYSSSKTTRWTKIRSLKEVLTQTMKEKTTANDYYGDQRIDGKKNFVIRRWFEVK